MVWAAIFTSDQWLRDHDPIIHTHRDKAAEDWIEVGATAQLSAALREEDEVDSM